MPRLMVNNLSAEHRKRIFALVEVKAPRPMLPIKRYRPKLPLLAVPTECGLSVLSRGNDNGRSYGLLCNPDL